MIPQRVKHSSAYETNTNFHWPPHVVHAAKPAAGRDAFHCVPDKASDAHSPRISFAQATGVSWNWRSARINGVRKPRAAYADDNSLAINLLWPDQGRGGTRPYRAFTLIELLAIIAILEDCSCLHDTRQGKAASREAPNNPKQIGRDLKMWVDDNRD